MADKITLEQALTEAPVWLVVGENEPNREIEVSMTYKELMAIKKLWDRYQSDKENE